MDTTIDRAYLEFVPCLLCGRSESIPVRHFNSNVELVKCLKCGFLYTNPRPTKNILAATYNHNTYYDTWWFRNGASRDRMWSRRLNIVKRCTPEVGKLLDVGTGTGDFLIMARKAGWDISATEISAWAGEYTAKKTGVSVYCGELTEADLPSGYYDLITFWHTLEHLTDPFAYLVEAHRLLNENGRLIVAVPNMNDIVYSPWKNRLTAYRQVFSAREPHLAHFTPDTLRRMVEKAGFATCFMTTDPLGLGTVRTMFDFIAKCVERVSSRLVGRAILGCATKKTVTAS